MANLVQFTGALHGKTVFVNVDRVCYLEMHHKHEDQTTIVFDEKTSIVVGGSPEQTYLRMDRIAGQS
jgi:hypothetical protein